MGMRRPLPPILACLARLPCLPCLAAVTAGCAHPAGGAPDGDAAPWFEAPSTSPAHERGDEPPADALATSRAADGGDAAAAREATAAALPAGARPISGTYGELTLGLEWDGETVTGYFSSAAGLYARFECTFYLRGRLDRGRARIATWFPADRARVIGGMLTVTPGGTIGIHLDQEHGGCGNVRHFADPAPATFDRDAAGTWSGVRVVSSARAHFFARPDSEATEKAYGVTGDMLLVAETRPDGWVRGRIHQTEGWLREADLFDDRVPLALGDAGPAGVCTEDLVWDTAARACRMVPDGPYGWAGCSLLKHPPSGFRCVTGASWVPCTCKCSGTSLFDPMTNTCR